MLVGVVVAVLAIAVAVKLHLQNRKLASEIARLNNQVGSLSQLSTTDPLTGLYSSRGLLDVGKHVIASALRDGTKTIVAFIDVGQFKAINDRFGHPAGDRMLQKIAQTVMRLRSSDVTARYGGDEFVIITHGDEDGMAGLAKAIKARLTEINRWAVEEGLSPVTLNVGVAVLSELKVDIYSFMVSDTSRLTVKWIGQFGVDQSEHRPACLTQFADAGKRSKLVGEHASTVHGQAEQLVTFEALVALADAAMYSSKPKGTGR